MKSAVVRQRVDGREAAVPFYERLTGQAASRFAFSGVGLGVQSRMITGWVKCGS